MSGSLIWSCGATGEGARRSTSAPKTFVTIFCDHHHRHKILTYAKLSFVVCLHKKTLFDSRKLRRLAGVTLSVAEGERIS